jgi:predicted AAA+ superfamily ATPase
MAWRRDFIRSYLERDIPQLGPRIPAETLRRFWTMLAHRHGGLHNAAVIAASLGVDGKTVATYLDLFVDLLLVRRLEPWHQNVGKRLVKSPKIYFRDSGILHCLLGLETWDDLLGHTIAGASWEGFVIENIIAAMPEGGTCFFYRTAAGAEIDLVLELPRQRRWAIEIKRSLSPDLSKGFYLGCADIKATHRRVVYPGNEVFPLDENTLVTPLAEILKELRAKEPPSK